MLALQLKRLQIPLFRRWHVCQNLYLAGESLSCGVCAVAAFPDDAMNELLRLDGRKQFVIYIAALGKV